MLYRKKCEEIQHEEGRESNTSVNGGKTEWWPNNGMATEEEFKGESGGHPQPHHPTL